MSLLNTKCILLVALIGVAGWNFPWGIVLDVGILVVWASVKRKRVPSAMQGPKAGMTPQAQSNDSFNALAMTMFSDKVAGATIDAANELGIQPSKVRSPARPSLATPADADMAYKMKLLD